MNWSELFHSALDVACVWLKKPQYAVHFCTLPVIVKVRSRARQFLSLACLLYPLAKNWGFVFHNAQRQVLANSFSAIVVPSAKNKC